MGLSARHAEALSPAGVSRELISILSAWRYEDIPKNVIERLKLLLLDTLGVIAAAAKQHEVVRVNRRLARWTPHGSATALIDKRPLPPPFAALANGTAAHALDFDDIHDAARVHSFAVLVPALLAVAEDKGGIDGRSFLLALAVGSELNARLGLAAPHALAVGWHPSTIFGALAAGYCCARLLNLDETGQLGAFGFAHHLAAGSSESILSAAPSKRIGLGFAAQAGVMAASLAADGVLGPTEPLTGRAGLFALQLRDEANPAALTDGLGQHWEILAYQFKPYPCCRCCHSTITLGIGLNNEGLAIENVKHIEIRLSRLNTNTVGKPYDPTLNSSSHAQFNVAFCFAAALVDGKVGVSSFTPARFADPNIVILTTRTEVRTDPDVASDAMEPACVRLTLNDGTIVERKFAAPASAFDTEALLAKARACLAEGLGADAQAIARLEEAALGLDRLPAISTLVAAFPAIP